MSNTIDYSSTQYNYQGISWSYPKEEWLSEFDKKIRNKWDLAMDAGLFRYNLSDVTERLIPGKYNYITQLNLKRGVERRKPENIQSMSQRFDPNKFNFTKVKEGEILAELKISTDDTQMPNRHANSPMEDRHVLLINVSPLEYGHLLVVPSIDNELPQVLTETAVRLSVQLMLLSKHPGFRVGFNSLCAYASVNHLHLHAWYVEHTLATENAAVELIGNDCFTTTDYPAKAFVLQLHGHSVEEFSRKVFTVANILQTRDVAHNMFITRGQEMKDGKSRTIRVYLWPRISIFGDMKKELPIALGAKFEMNPVVFNVAVAELGGHVPVYHGDRFSTLAEDEIVQHIHGMGVPSAEFDELQKDILDALK